MGVLNREVYHVQNPALGATLLWRFSVGYSDGTSGDNAPLPLLFIVLPIIFHEETQKILSSTLPKSGLHKFSNKFNAASTARNDLLLAIHDRMHQYRSLTLDSLNIAIAANLILLDNTEASVIAISKTEPTNKIPKSIRPMTKGAYKLGSWCSDKSLYEISMALKVSF